MDDKLPRPLRDLIKRCWAPKAQDRPTMAEALESLQNMQRSISFDRLDKEAQAELDERMRRDVGGGCCCTVS